MKTPRIADALNQIDDDLVNGAVRAKNVKKNNWLKWGSIAACFVVMLAALLAVMPMLFEKDSLIITPDNEPVNDSSIITPDNNSVGNEGNSTVVPQNNGVNGDGNGEVEVELESYYDYGINSGAFATYINGKVIDAEKIGAKLESVTVTGGWKNEAGEWMSIEALNAEVYAIEGISSDVAVALKFINQGEGVTTIHYYVMMNPAADLSIVEEYVREPIVQNNPGDEMVNE